MLSKINSVVISWLMCEKVEVEIDISRGLSAFQIVWLWDAAVQESKERVRSSVKNSWFKFPNTRITVNLAPADRKKKWPFYDLPIAVWILSSIWQVNFEENFLKETLFIWELSLNWDLKHIPWVLPVAIFAKENWFKRICLPKINAKEASLIEWVEILWFKNLDEIYKFSLWELEILPEKTDRKLFDEDEDFLDRLDFRHIKWQEHVKRALEICASWSHNILLNWTPWSWKTLMARSLQTILPKMTINEAIEVTKIYSVANKLDKSLITTRPFRTVHHTASSVSIVWWWNALKPWEISMAHRWVLFLDEFAEFPANVLEVLRQPIEDKKISISRASWTVEFPAQFTLVWAMNPCYCGYFWVPNAWKECTCNSQMISKYQKKISWPLLDRIDLYCDVSPVKFEDLKSMKEWESSKEIRKRVQKSKDIQIERFKNLNIQSNSEMSHVEIKEFCEIWEDSEWILKLSAQKYNLSARSIHRVLKISRTIADLQWIEEISFENIAEALQYRSKISEN